MNILFIAVLVVIALVLGGAIVAFTGGLAALILIPLLLVLLVGGAIRMTRGASSRAERADLGAGPDPFEAPPPARRDLTDDGELSHGGGVQG